LSTNGADNLFAGQVEALLQQSTPGELLDGRFIMRDDDRYTGLASLFQPAKLSSDRHAILASETSRGCLGLVFLGQDSEAVPSNVASENQLSAGCEPHV